MIDIRSVYASIANQAITRACEAFEKHGSFKDIDEAHAVVREEYDELMYELTFKIYNVERAYQESIDLAVTALRCAHFLKSQLPAPEEAPKLSDVIGLTWEGKD